MIQIGKMRLIRRLHGNPGCGVINYLSNGQISGSNPSFSGYSIPGTAAQERHVIFGGASRLREQIKNTIKVAKGDLYVILNSCESAMVGDDVDAMTREIVEQGEPVVDTLVAGFNGGTHYGYEHVLADIFKSIYDVKKAETNKQDDLVNIFGIVPAKDPFWQGNIDETKRILMGFGLKVNVIFGVEGGVDDLVNAKNAAASIVFSRWGLLPASYLKENYDIPIISLPFLPTGHDSLINLKDALNDVISLDEAKEDAFISSEAVYESRLFHRLGDLKAKGTFSKDAVIVADEETATRIATYFVGNFGMEINAIVITDATLKDTEHDWDAGDVLSNLSENIYYTTDQKEIDDIINSASPEVIFASSLEKRIAAKLNIPLVEISYPVFDKLILNKASAGTKGIATFIEEYTSIVQAFDKAKRDSLKQYLKDVKGGESWRELSQGKNFSKKSNSITELQTREYISALK